jgi:hypothetical protein
MTLHDYFYSVFSLGTACALQWAQLLNPMAGRAIK